MSFWQAKTLQELSEQEWESLCDGCGQCCLQKLEDEDTGQIAVTNVVCELLDLSTCRCARYERRIQEVPECIDLKRYGEAAFRWLPVTCAYRLLAEGKDLPTWHPLLSGSAKSVHEAGQSIRSYAIPGPVADELLEDHIIDWLD